MVKSKIKRLLKFAQGNKTFERNNSDNVIKLPITIKALQFSETVDMSLEVREDTSISSVNANIYSANFTNDSKAYFRTSNLQSKFTTLPTGSVVPVPLDNYRSIQIDYSVNLSSDVQLSLYLIWYSDEVRIQSMQYDLISSELIDEQNGAKFFDVPEGAKSLGAALRVSGVGQVEFLHLNVNLFELKKIQVDPVLKRMSQDPDPFIQNAILFGMSEYPELTNEPYRMLRKLIANGHEHAILEVIKKYEHDIGKQVHRLVIYIYSRLLMMSDLVDYYESLPLEIQKDFILKQQYYKALIWDSQDSKLRDLIVKAISYPTRHTKELPNYMCYAELLRDCELKVLTQIILNNDVDKVNLANLLHYISILNSRHQTYLIQSLVSFLHSKLKTAYKIDWINYYLMLSNFSHKQKDYFEQLWNINLALKKSHLLTVSLINPNIPFAPSNLTCSDILAYKDKLYFDGALITVIMTTWNSENTLKYAIRSVLNQTHQNIELIVVDDASSDNTPELIKEIARTDNRIVPVLLKQNGGTYVAKNHGRMIAKGEFVTCQDSDDWAHPQKISKLVKFLAKNDHLIGVECGHVRVSKTNGIQKKPAGMLRKDASSLLYKRLEAEQAIGFYENVRAGADGEFKFRLQRYFGVDTIGYIGDLLSIVDWADGTLSGSNSRYAISSSGVFASSRLNYRQSFQKKHEYGLFEDGKASLYRPHDAPAIDA